jgi:hypothetical protein
LENQKGKVSSKELEANVDIAGNYLFFSVTNKVPGQRLRTKLNTEDMIICCVMRPIVQLWGR